MGDLLHWWKFDKESEKIETFDVLIPAHKGQDVSGNYWILRGFFHFAFEPIGKAFITFADDGNLWASVASSPF